MCRHFDILPTISSTGMGGGGGGGGGKGLGFKCNGPVALSKHCARARLVLRQLKNLASRVQTLFIFDFSSFWQECL